MKIEELRTALLRADDEAKVYIMTSDMRLSEKKPVIGVLVDDKDECAVIIGTAEAV